MIHKIPFGRTGHDSTRIIFGAFALAEMTQAQADATLDLLLDYGVNHIDTAPTYGDSELRIGPWMKRHRQDFFVATKVSERTYDSAWASIRESLQRLQVDQLDLLQLHDVSVQDVWDQVMGEGGALQAVLEARDQGLTRFIGITGHNYQIGRLHREALERVDFDSVLLPYNIVMMQDAQYAADFERLVAICGERDVAVQTIKGVARRLWGGRPQQGNTWYEPLMEQADIDQAVHWILGRPGIFLNTAGDVDILRKILDAAARYRQGQALPDMAALATARAMETVFA
ncbi:MAG: aldo/keto reductase [Caldilineales bacterium]|nr:aldo/keto reductase [Caldilineales bacterium]